MSRYMRSFDKVHSYFAQLYHDDKLQCAHTPSEIAFLSAKENSPTAHVHASHLITLEEPGFNVPNCSFDERRPALADLPPRKSSVPPSMLESNDCKHQIIIFYQIDEAQLNFHQHVCHAATRRILSHLLQETTKRIINHERDLVAVLPINAVNTASERCAIMLAAHETIGVLKCKITKLEDNAIYDEADEKTITRKLGSIKNRRTIREMVHHPL